MAVRIDLTLDCANATRLAASGSWPSAMRTNPPGPVRHPAGVAASSRPRGQRVLRRL